MGQNRISFSMLLLTLGLFASLLHAKGVSKKEALEKIQSLPEVRAFQKEVAASKLGGKFLLYPESTDVAEPLYQFYVGESLRDHTNRWNTFGVDKKSGEIFVMDMVKGKFLPYASWKKNLP